MQKPVNIATLVLWIAVVGMVLLIFLFSSQIGHESVSRSERIVDYLIRSLNLQESIQNNEWVYEHRNYIFRKIMHFLEYLILAVLLFISLKFLNKLKLKEISILTLLLACLIASIDEYFQSKIPGRTPRVIDVLIDTSGALSAILIILFSRKMIRK